jgi:prevent-host-death family protein
MKVPAAEFQRNIGVYQDRALVEPVFVTRNGRPRTVLISVEEYQRLKRRDREALGVEELSEGDVTAIASSKVDARHAHLGEDIED